MNKLEQAWQGRTWLSCLLWPVSLLMHVLVGLRRCLFRYRLLRSKDASLPVVVVGNLSVGGTGKSPLTAALVEYFQEMDWRPGIVSRGYGGSHTDTPQNVLPSSNPSELGDEPVMLAKMTGVPICVCTDRAAAVQAIVQQHPVDIVFSDDGLQHYAMARDVEIVVVDESRGFGNGWLLPAGPLREPVSRLKTVSLLALHRSANSDRSGKPQWDDSGIPDTLPMGAFQLKQTHLRKVNESPSVDASDRSEAADTEWCLSDLSGRKVHAVAGIGDPTRFFRQLMLAGIQVIEHPKPDHHEWSVSDLQFKDEHPIVVTSKDAVKVKRVLGEFQGAVDIFEVCVKAVLSADLSNAIASVEDQLHKTYRQPQQGIR